ncbi:MAG: acetyl-CoA hydrolase/transferase family protein [Pseudomonadota bacterium]
MPRWIQAAEVGALLRPGMTVFVAGGAAEPRAIGRALRAQPEASAGVTYVGAVFPGARPTPFADLHPDARLLTCMLTPGLRELYAAGRVGLVPLQYRAIYDWLERALEPDIALLQLTPPDAGGRCAYGLRLDFQPAALARAKLVVAEINRALPRLPGCPTIGLEEIDCAVEVERPPALEPPPAIDATARAIGAEIARWVRDGDCLQVGVGSIPDAALAALAGHNDLGVHSGMIAHGIAALARRGVITGARKALDRGRIVTGFVTGDADTLDWAQRTPELQLRPVNYTHDQGVLAGIDNFVAINSAVEVDLFGQINAEMIGGRQHSGTGGGLDFIRGALRARGGRSIIALPATAAGGTVSRIVPALAQGTVATAPRTDADLFITEYGAAAVRHLDTRARAEALIGIAAPRFRDWLRAAWRA